MREKRNSSLSKTSGGQRSSKPQKESHVGLKNEKKEKGARRGSHRGLKKIKKLLGG